MTVNKSNNTIQAAWVALGSLFAFGFSIVSSIILSRYFDKTDYGTYKQVIYVYHTLLIVFTLGLPKTYSYFLPRTNDCYVKSLVKKITTVFYILGALFSFSLFFFSPQLAKILNNPDLELALKVFSPVPFILLPTMGIEGIFATYNKNKYMALYNVVSKSFILICICCSVIVLEGNYLTAIVGFTIASLISLLFANYLKHRCLRDKGSAPTLVSFKEIIKFSIPLLRASIWGLLLGNCTSYFISRYFGTKVFAEFSNGALELPFVGMIVNACSTVLLPFFSPKNYESVNAKDEILIVWKNAFEKTIKLTYPLVMFFCFYSYDVMEFLYGAQYHISGLYFRIMLISSFFTVIAYAPILIAIGATSFFSRVHFVGACCVIVLQYTSILLFNSSFVVTAIYVVCNGVMIVSMLLYITKYFNTHISTIIPFKTVGLITVISFVLSWVTKLFSNNIPVLNNSLQVIMVSFAFYFFIYLMASNIFRIDYSYVMKLFSFNKK